MSSNRRCVSWTDFNQINRVAILSVHQTEAAGIRSVKRFRKIYPNLKLVPYPDGVDIQGNTDLQGDQADLIRQSTVIFE